MNENTSPESLGMTWSPSGSHTHTYAAPTPTNSTTALPDVPKREKPTREDARKHAMPDLHTLTWMRVEIFDNTAQATKGKSPYVVKLSYCTDEINTRRPDGVVYISMLQGSKIKKHALKHFDDEESARMFYEPLMEARTEQPELRAGFVAVKSPALQMGTVTFTDQFAILNFAHEMQPNGFKQRIAMLTLSINGDILSFDLPELDRDTKGASKFLGYHDPHDYNSHRKQKAEE